MKKIVLSLAGVLAATAFAPEAAAIPSFSRQTGMACSACHFQHFPVLNSFGMAFKAAGYTMMGAQGKIEGEHLSIPDTLNGSIVMKIRYEKQNGTDAAGTLKGTTANGGILGFPDELALFFGGKMAENAGYLAEIGLGVGAGNPDVAASGAGIGGFKVPFLFDAGGAKVGVVPFFTDVGSFAHGFELSSSGLVRGLRWTEDRSMLSTDSTGLSSGAATGFAFVAKNDMGYINLTRWAPDHMGNSGSSVQMKSNWLRIAATPTYADWNMHIGLGHLSGHRVVSTDVAAVAAVAGTVNANGVLTGTVTAVTAAAKGTVQDTKATLLDFQGQTQLAGKDFSLYASYVTVPTSPAAGNTNYFNTRRAAAGVKNESAWNIGADYSVIPHVLHIAGAYRHYDSGAAAPAAGANGGVSNAYLVQGIYDLYQNVALHATYKHTSGNAVQAAGTATNRYYLMLEAAW